MISVVDDIVECRAYTVLEYFAADRGKGVVREEFEDRVLFCWIQRSRRC